MQDSAGGQRDSSSSRLENICCSVLVPDSKSTVNDNTHIKTNGHSGKEGKKKQTPKQKETSQQTPKNQNPNKQNKTKKKHKQQKLDQYFVKCIHDNLFFPFQQTSSENFWKH